MKPEDFINKWIEALPINSKDAAKKEMIYDLGLIIKENQPTMKGEGYRKRAEELYLNGHKSMPKEEAIHSAQFAVDFAVKLAQHVTKEKDEEIERLIVKLEKTDLAYNVQNQKLNDLHEKYEYEVECGVKKDEEIERLNRDVSELEQGSKGLELIYKDAINGRSLFRESYKKKREECKQKDALLKEMVQSFKNIKKYISDHYVSLLPIIEGMCDEAISKYEGKNNE